MWPCKRDGPRDEGRATSVIAKTGASGRAPGCRSGHARRCDAHVLAATVATPSARASPPRSARQTGSGRPPWRARRPSPTRPVQANAASNCSQTWDLVRKSQHRTNPALPPGKLLFMMVYDHNIKNFVVPKTNFRFFKHFSKNPRFGSQNFPIFRKILVW